MDTKRCLSVNLRGKSVLVLVTITVLGNTVQYTIEVNGQTFYGITTKGSDLEKVVQEKLNAIHECER